MITVVYLNESMTSQSECSIVVHLEAQAKDEFHLTIARQNCTHTNALKPKKNPIISAVQWQIMREEFAQQCCSLFGFMDAYRTNEWPRTNQVRMDRNYGKPSIWSC
mmetsp:Transcript_10898/g.31249  ORF Transcript_10898/g.31249 Transcript_10898/m.31249 type:complete len:106 (-) Transcript_10898:6-323(-)